uniref:Peptidase M10 metallopeptidase domain-containing protein n=1 Tax=Vespula pensylvanica TaxID=30213 RepID=A0A834K1C3_VESPE|nr:hypothetical protein H0235_016324 [Vespula pensylvanica]
MQDHTWTVKATTLKNFYYESLEYSLPLLLLQIKNFNNTNPNRLLALKQVKSNMIDVKIELIYAKNIVPNTTAYCFIDGIIEYNPLTNSTINVRMVSIKINNYSLHSVLVQEIGYALDLSYSFNDNAVLRPFYEINMVTLSNKDINDIMGMKRLYN